MLNPLGFEDMAVTIDIVAHQAPMHDRSDIVAELIDKAERRRAIPAEMAARLRDLFEVEATDA